MDAARGVGLGFRLEIAEAMLSAPPPEIDWVEVHPENYVQRAGRFEQHLARAKEIWPIVPHGLSLCFGSLEPFDRAYLRTLRTFLDSIGARWYSDHLCYGGVDGVAMHDLLPLPHSREAIALVRDRVAEVQDAIGRPVAVENVSFYAHPGTPETTEVEFLLEVLEKADCKLLLDVNNVYVNARNHGFDPRAYLDRIPADRVVQIHVAGHLVRPGMPIVDTHGEPLCEDVYDLLGYALRRVGDVPVLLERDGNFPPLAELIEEVRRIRAIAASAAEHRLREGRS